MTDFERDINAILELLNSQLSYKTLLHNLVLKRFVNVSNWKLPSTCQIKHHMIFWLHQQTLLHGNLTINFNTKFKLTNGALNYLYNSTLPVGYVLQFPRQQKIELQNTYFIARYGTDNKPIETLEDLPEVLHEFTNPHLSIFFMENAQLVASINHDMATY